tara:strand:- start:18726 stop:19109 length:384 start_codon:yes stop_codon:yes gene_type:complete
MKKIIIPIIILAVVVLGIFFISNKPKDTIKEVELTGETKEFDIVAKNWEFSPELIEVNLGDKVELHMESIEGTHGLAILGFGVSETLRVGEDIHAEFIADKIGIFNFYCNVPCGRGHGTMGGMLVVK